MKPVVSLLIPVHQGGEKFRQCLQSVHLYTPIGTQLIVVADGNTGNDASLARSFGATVLTTDQAVGAGLARNLAAQKATSDILFFMDADVCLGPTTLTQVLAHFETEPELAALIGSYDDAPAESNFLSQYRNLLHHYTHQNANPEASTFWGACGAIRRKDFMAIGGFSDGLLEDVELGYRLREAGYRIRLDPSIQVKHLKRWHTSLMLKTDIFIRAIPWTRLILRFQHLPNDLNLRVESRFSVILLFSLLLSLMAGFFELSAILAVALLILNLPIYRFFWQLKSGWFTLGVIPWHWFYYFYSGAAYAIGHFQHFFSDKQQ